MNWQHINTINWTRLNTKIAARTFANDDRVHMLGSTEYGIDWACLDALGATDALGFANEGYFGNVFDAVFIVKRYRFNVQQISQCVNACFPTRRAFINGVAIGNGLGIRFTTWIATLPTLRLRQYRINLIDYRIAVHFKANGAKTQKSAKNCAEYAQGK